MTRPFIATYRLQLSAEFTLRDACARVPYLRALGVSHVYCSPVLAARSGSTHGYDVTDPTHVSEALGGDEAFVEFANAAHAHGMGLLLDIVPNHMGVGRENPYWDDVLRVGRASRYADWFDVSWHAPTRALQGKVLVPTLGDTLAHVLARGELSVVLEHGAPRVKYFERSFPLDPATLPSELAEGDEERVGRWNESADRPGRMRDLLDRQHYVLAFWRNAQRDLNYRRFFDVNDLISLRVEREDVFEATHRKLLSFVGDGLVDGLRVDHIDGLLEPERYLERLALKVGHVPVYVEKILAVNEVLSERWRTAGTTGYEFMVAVDDLLIDAAGHGEIEAQYRETSRRWSFREVALASKRKVLRGALNADVRRVAPMLARLAKRASWPSRAIAEYARVIVESVAQLPVYRTYIGADQPMGDAMDRALLTDVVSRLRENAALDAQAVTALEQALLGDWSSAAENLRRERLTFVLRWQQLSGPAAAKGIEDTALYAYAPLTSRCEVGGDPGVSLENADARLFARLEERAQRLPLSLNATNTHDAKRSADARARIDALSEHSHDWLRLLRRWRRLHEPLRVGVHGQTVPSRAAEDFVYQAMFALWPLTARSMARDAWLPTFRGRIAAYLEKAMREAKVVTSWTDPDEAYERAVLDFAGRVLELERDATFFDDMSTLVERTAPQALWNMLGRTALHLMSPGVPDIYQGDEVWFSALVDPDNRRPVDWELRSNVLAQVQSGGERLNSLTEWRDAMDVDALKLFAITELLGVRRAHHDLFRHGGVSRVPVSGAHAANVFAFRRDHGSESVIVAIVRTTASLSHQPIGAVWGHTTLTVDDARKWSCAIHRTEHRPAGARLHLADIFSVLPVAVLVADAHGLEGVG